MPPLLDNFADSMIDWMIELGRAEIVACEFYAKNKTKTIYVLYIQSFQKKDILKKVLMSMFPYWFTS